MSIFASAILNYLRENYNYIHFVIEDIYSFFTEDEIAYYTGTINDVEQGEILEQALDELAETSWIVKEDVSYYYYFENTVKVKFHELMDTMTIFTNFVNCDNCPLSLHCQFYGREKVKLAEII